jgi:exoribonuclease II
MRQNPREHLAELAAEAMQERGLEPEFPPAAMAQLVAISARAPERGNGIRDLTKLLWCSIDNDDSRDLDQLTVSETLPGGDTRILVAIADVDTLVGKDTPIDKHAQTNTTSVYTGARIFSMLPEKLSTDLTSLNPCVDRLAVVTDMVFTEDGTIKSTSVYRALVRNQAKLAYDSVSDWLDGKAPLPEAAAAVSGMDQQLRVQDKVAQTLRTQRREAGALEFQTFQPKATFADGQVIAIRQQDQNRARQLIEEFMIATNGVNANFLASKKFASIRRVVRNPKNWDRIVELAAERGVSLPKVADSAALTKFLTAERKRDPVRFPDLSLSIIKLMGSGEYVVEMPGANPVGHFGLAVREYTHATAPNRRYPDLITSRLLKAALADAPPPYSHAELSEADVVAHWSSVQ